MKEKKRLIKQNGIGIIELMVSITIGLFILAGVFHLYLTSTQNVSTFEGSSRIQENARYVFARLENDFAGAGNLGCFSMVALKDSIDVNVMLGESDGRYDFTSFIGGENDSGPGIGGGNSTDTLLVRYFGHSKRYPVLEIVDEVSLKADSDVVDRVEEGQVIALSDCAKVSVFAVSGKDTGTDVIEHEVFSAAEVGDPYNALDEINIGDGTPMVFDAAKNVEGTLQPFIYIGSPTGLISYEIQTSAAGVAAVAACGDATPEFCALRRDGVEVVEGVEDLQFEYGWVEAAGLKFADAQVIEDAANTDLIWRLIDRVKVTATFNSISTATTNDGSNLLRRTYSRVFALPNQLPVSL